MTIFKRIFGFLKPAFNYTKQSLPVLLFLGFMLLIIAIWWWGSNWVVFDYTVFPSTAAKWVGTLILFFIMSMAYVVVLIRRNATMEKEKLRDENDIKDPILPYERDQEEKLNAILTSLKENIPSRNYLYKLPWFLVIGLENSGKTSLINRSGQKFSLTTVERTSKRYQRSDTPYKIDWWVGNDAILIDPDGELISQQDTKADKEANVSSRLWLHFIQWLEKTRSRRPLNGIVLVVDLPKLIGSSNSDREAMAGVFRTRIQELIESLGTRLPIYVVLNKLDLISGFDVLFQRLKKDERESTFGFSFSIDKEDDVDAWTSEFETQFKGFVNNLNEITFDMMSTIIDQTQRESVYSFVRQMDGAKEILFQYLSDILESDRFTTPAITRGVYFTSLFQQGVPQDFVKLAVSGNYKLPVPIPTATPDIKQKTYFSAKLFPEIIYSESGLAGDNIKVARQKRLVFGIGSVVAGLATVMLLMGWNYYYYSNKKLADNVIELTTAFSKDKVGDQEDTSGKYLLDTMDRIRQAALVFGDYREATPIVENLGLYQGKKIGAKVDEAYKEILSKKFLPAIAVGLLDKMNQEEIGSNESLSVLRVYRMFEDLDNRRKDIAESWMATEWQKTFPNDGDTQRRLMTHFSYAMSNVETDLSDFSSLIRRKQHELKQIPLEQRIYNGIKQTANAELYYPMDLRNEVGPVFDEIYDHEQKGDFSNTDKDQSFSRYQVDAFFTVPGFKEYFTPQLNNVMDLALIDGWVLGQRERLDYSAEDKNELSKKIREIYVADYINVWRNELNDLDIVDFKNIPHAVSVLSSITSSSNPFQRLLSVVKEQSAIYPPLPEGSKEENDLIAKNLNRTASLKITRTFVNLVNLLEPKGEAPPYIDELITALEELHVYIKGIQDSPETGKAALTTAKNRLVLDGADPVFTLTRIANGLPEPLSKQVNQIADNAWKVILIAAVEELERKWHEDIYSFYQERIVSRYPFVKESSVGISVNDFEEFFGPKGRLQVFYDDYLKLFLEENKGVLSVNGSGSLVRDDFLDNLQAAWDIQDSFFDTRGGLHVEFSLQALGLSGDFRRSVMDIDGQLINYNHGPSYAARLIWPNTLRDRIESKLTMISSNGKTERIQYSGTWSWFRLMDTASLIGVNGNAIDLRFKVGSGVMNYQLSADDANNPFIRKPFTNFSLPERILKNNQISLAQNKDAQ